MIDLQDPEDRMAAAGEYVLGTLSADDEAAFVAALAADEALRADVFAWQDRLLPLTAATEPVTPRPQLWRRVEVALTARSAGVARPTAPRASASSSPSVPWWQRLRVWQGAASFAVACCLVMAVLLVQRGAPTGAPDARYLAVLQSPENQSTGWIVEARAGGTVRLVPVGTTPPVPAGRSLQFWTKAEGAAGPTSLGLVRAGQPLELPVAQMPTLGERQLFEITLEPANGSPVGRPTGPILFVGKTVLL